MFDNNPVITNEEWIFKIRAGKPIVLSKNKKNKQLKYLGTIYDQLDGNHMIITFSRKSGVIFARKVEVERFTMRLVHHAHTKPDANILGLWVGRTYDGNLVSGVVIVSRRPLSEEEVMGQVRKFTFDSNAFVIRES